MTTRRILISTAGGSTFIVAAIAISWAVFYESSPIYQGPYNEGVLAKIWMILNIIPIMAGFVAGGHSGSPAVMAVAGSLQWFLIGFIVVYIVQAFRSRND